MALYIGNRSSRPEQWVEVSPRKSPPQLPPHITPQYDMACKLMADLMTRGVEVDIYVVMPDSVPLMEGEALLEYTVRDQERVLDTNRQN